MSMSKLLIFTGILLLTSGLIIYFFENKLGWFGNLPFDFKYESRKTKIFAPFGSMIIVSLVLSFLFNFFYKLFK